MGHKPKDAGTAHPLPPKFPFPQSLFTKVCEMIALALEKEKFHFFVYVGYSLTGKEQRGSFLGLGEKPKAERLRKRELPGPAAYTKRSQIPCFEDASALLLT